MSEATGWQRFFPLFLKYGLLPEPEKVGVLRKKLKAKLAVTEPQSSRKAGSGVKAWHAEIEKQRAAMDAELDAVRRDIQSYRDWAPTGNDWISLAVVLAIKCQEPGFEFTKPIKDKTADSNWHRDRLMRRFITVDKVDAKSAAMKAENHIASEQKAGRGMEFGKPMSAKSLAAGYSTRNKARQRVRLLAEVDNEKKDKSNYCAIKTPILRDLEAEVEAQINADKVLLNENHKDRASLYVLEVDLLNSYRDHFHKINSEAISITQRDEKESD